MKPARRATRGGEHKSDPRDARVIADQVRNRDDLRVVAPLREADAELALLVARRRELVTDQTRRINRLRELLCTIAPGIERTVDPTNKVDLALLARYVTPSEIRRAGKTRITTYLRRTGRHTATVMNRLVEAVTTAASQQRVSAPAEALTGYTCLYARRIVAYRRVGWLAPKPKLRTDVDLSGYEQLGDPDQPVTLTKRHHQNQANGERIQEYVHSHVQERQPLRLSDDDARRLRDLLFPPGGRRPQELVKWRLRLYRRHVVEKAAHHTHKTVHSALTGSMSCPECGRGPATIGAARVLGRLEEPDQPKLPKPSRDSLERRLHKLEAEAARLRDQLAEIEEQSDD